MIVSRSKYPVDQWFLTFVTRMLLNCNSQKPQSGQLVAKASGSCSPKFLSNPRLRTSAVDHHDCCHWCCQHSGCPLLCKAWHNFSAGNMGTILCSNIRPYPVFLNCWYRSTRDVVVLQVKLQKASGLQGRKTSSSNPHNKVSSHHLSQLLQI